MSYTTEWVINNQDFYNAVYDYTDDYTTNVSRDASSILEELAEHTMLGFEALLEKDKLTKKAKYNIENLKSIGK